MTQKLVYDDIIVTNGIKVPFVPEIITPVIERPMRNGRYETGECKALSDLLQAGDTVLELGAGVGLLSTVAALSEGVKKVITVEANPEIIPLIKETHRLNGARNVTLVNAIAMTGKTKAANFYLRKDFWASSMEPDSRPYERAVKVPGCNISQLVAEHRPTVIVCDIEGGELGLFDDVDLSGVRAIIIEFHAKVYGQKNVDAISRLFAKNGLAVVPVDKPTTVRRFLRRQPSLAEQNWPPRDPRFLVTTCMKDEGPFILEWIAWHKSIGVQDFVVFSNDCSDGTDLILDRLEAMGYLRHLPNPAIATGSTFFQPAALSYTPHLPQWRKADFYISMDVDEFINVRVGDGKMSDLLAATGFFDALSMSELIHGANEQLTFIPGLVTEQFPRHQSETPGFRKSQRGVKTITRISEKLAKPRNHRPDFHADQAEPVWLDGSGRPVETLPADPALNGIDVRGSYDLVALDHFPLRSLESYLIKMFRGDVVVKGNRVSQRYWRLRNRNEENTSTFARQQPDFRAELGKLLSDTSLRDLHERACNIHLARAKQLIERSEYRARRDWILENDWHTA
ncbi:MAG: FkbM family methyltransferase [Yoonia sp.]|uniref:FkbM family methyltransferase n=1 Tax=Yoonia sp. TaxID=2212373 RepID=UPI00273D7EAF|nr:FkbM family methyltransferase [Yoonia sp.]MDP5083956.1 FkbM family methyltransferase [Yoonia sp.]